MSSIKSSLESELLISGLDSLYERNSATGILTRQLTGLGSGLYTGYYCPFILPKGIRVGSTVDEMKAAYGEPYEERLDYIEYKFYSPDKTLCLGGAFLCPKHAYDFKLHCDKKLR